MIHELVHWLAEVQVIYSLTSYMTDSLIDSLTGKWLFNRFNDWLTNWIINKWLLHRLVKSMIHELIHWLAEVQVIYSLICYMTDS
jgi:hypothetical protein